MNGAARRGTVYLVGAGPGDAGLVTTRALELVRSADVLFADRLIPAELLDEVRSDARVVYVGKTAGDHAMPQEEINQRLVDEALRGHSVVRVKGGDPYLFGRGGEEALHCKANDVPFETVPAVTSAFAACAAAGIPVTHRDLARNVTVVTASAGRDGQGDPDYEWLARSDGTLIFLMGLRRVAHVADALIAGGADRHRPAAVISRATTGSQRSVTGTLATIAEVVEAAELASPAIIVVGDVVQLRDQLNWFEQRPLFGTSIVVTRARAQASDVVGRLTELGASVVELPAIRIEPLDPGPLDALIDDIANIDTLVFTSRNGAECYFARLRVRGLDSRSLGGVRVAVVGEATADACRSRNVHPDLVPEPGSRTSMGLLEHLGSLPIFGTRVAIVRAQHGDDRLVEGLRSLGVDVSLVPVYRTVVEPASEQQAAALVAADVVTFASASSVTNTVAMLPLGGAIPPAITIGPTTSEAALAAGVRVLAQAAEPSIEALVAAVVDRAHDNADCHPWRHAAHDAPH